VDENEDVMADHNNLIRMYLLPAYMVDWILLYYSKNMFTGTLQAELGTSLL
jgi:hypothetical protein